MRLVQINGIACFYGELARIYVINVFTLKLLSVYVGEVLEPIISYGFYIERGGCDLT